MKRPSLIHYTNSSTCRAATYLIHRGSGTGLRVGLRVGFDWRRIERNSLIASCLNPLPGDHVILYFVLAVAPIIYGIYGLITGRLPVSSKRSLNDADARRYSILFIAFSIAIVTLTASLALIGSMIENAAVLADIAFYVLLIGLPLGLAIILDRATKRARRAMYKSSKTDTPTGNKNS